MDWGTHVFLAVNLLESCKLDKGAAIYSLLPVIDVKPAHYHRVYAHIIENQHDILNAGLDILGSEEVASRDFEALNERVKLKIANLKADLVKGNDDENRDLERKIYAYSRITEEAKTFVDLAAKTVELLGDVSISNISNDKMSAGVSLISHIYFDTYNNPVQGFLPYSSIASAQWDFWDNIHYMKFRSDFFSEENITLFRREVAESKVWNAGLNPAALIETMIIRLGEMGQPAIKYEIVDGVVRRFLRYMGIDTYQKADRELKFCRDLEAFITETIMTRFGKGKEVLPFKIE